LKITETPALGASCAQEIQVHFLATSY